MAVVGHECAKHLNHERPEVDPLTGGGGKFHSATAAATQRLKCASKSWAVINHRLDSRVEFNSHQTSQP